MTNNKQLTSCNWESSWSQTVIVQQLIGQCTVLHYSIIIMVWYWTMYGITLWYYYYGMVLDNVWYYIIVLLLYGTGHRIVLQRTAFS